MGLVVTLLGVVLNMFRQTQKDMQAEIKRSTDDLTKVKVLVAGKYVTRDDFDNKMTAMFRKLDHISDKLSSKVDK